MSYLLQKIASIDKFLRYGSGCNDPDRKFVFYSEFVIQNKANQNYC